MVQRHSEPYRIFLQLFRKEKRKILPFVFIIEEEEVGT